MRIGIVGSGKIGGTLTELFARQGHEVTVANSRGPESLGELVGRAGTTRTPAPLRTQRPSAMLWSLRSPWRPTTRCRRAGSTARS